MNTLCISRAHGAGNFTEKRRPYPMNEVSEHCCRKAVDGFLLCFAAENSRMLKLPEKLFHSLVNIRINTKKIYFDHRHVSQCVKIFFYPGICFSYQ